MSAECFFVDGEYRSSSSGGTIAIRDPTRDVEIGRSVAGTTEDVDIAVRAAASALREPTWADAALEKRVAIVLRLAELLERDREDLARLAAQEMGWPIASGRRLGDSVGLIRASVAAATRLDLEYVRRGGTGHDALVIRRPIGVVGGVLPWNAPLRAAVKKAIPALIAGCSVVLKPAPETPFDALRLAELAIEAGLPPGVLNVVPGATEAGVALVEHPLVRKIAFTGSTATGRSIARAGGLGLKRLQLELGGKSAAIFLDDADAAAAAKTLTAQTYRAAGQTCTALTRALVPRRHLEEYVERFREMSLAEVVGDPLDERTTMGPLISRGQRDRVLSMLDAARASGGTVLGGERIEGAGWFMRPAVVSGVEPDAAIAREEIFGPVLVVLPYDDEDDAVRIANDSDYGLHGGVFSADRDRALAVARRFDTGSVALDGRPIPIEAPFGGVKASGLGREHGPEGYDHFLEYQVVVIDRDHADQLIASGIPER